MKSFTLFLNVAALILYGIATIATCSAVWNNKDAKPVYYVIAGLLFLANAFVIYRRAKEMEKQIKDNGGIK